ncbi:MAG: hypothetical protein Q9203_003351 [Teloschistes exilis]
MSANTIPTPTTAEGAMAPIQLHVPPSLTAFAVSVPTFLANNPQYNRLACSASIFATPPRTPSSAPFHTSFPSSLPFPIPMEPEQKLGTSTIIPSSSSSFPFQPEPQLLLIHRAAHDNLYPSFWETPGGTCETSDPTVLHSLAREVYEETGLRVTRFLAQVGKGSEFTHHEPGDTTIYHGLKLSFVLEVAEVNENEAKARGRLEGIPMRLDPEEHQRFVWAREEEVNDGFREVGREIVPGDLRGRMLAAWGIFREVRLDDWRV